MVETTSEITSGTDPERYRSYLLRLWREAPGAPWRCQVHCVGSGQERRLAGLERLFDFLEAELSEASRPGEAWNQNQNKGECVCERED
jgi:hypothetical protein